MRWLTTLTLFLFASVIATESPRYDLKKAGEYFEKFVTKYKKSYSFDLREKVMRLKIFSDNLKIINRLNSKNEAVYAVTEFADLTETEFVEQTGSLVEILPSNITLTNGACGIIQDHEITSGVAPETLDYRNKGAVTSVKKQYICNSCWALVSAACLEGAYAIKHGVLYTLSAQQLMDCLTLARCQEKGSNMVRAFSALIDEKIGVMSDDNYPYVDRDEKCKYNASEVKVNVTACTNFKIEKEEKLREVLNQYGPVGMAVSGAGIQFYKSGIVSAEVCPVKRANHAVLLVGYGSEGQGYWTFKNSWGSDWGEQGYFRLEMGRNTCGILNKHIVIASVE